MPAVTRVGDKSTGHDIGIWGMPCFPLIYVFIKIISGHFGF